MTGRRGLRANPLSFLGFLRLAWPLLPLGAAPRASAAEGGLCPARALARCGDNLTV